MAVVAPKSKPEGYEAMPEEETKPKRARKSAEAREQKHPHEDKYGLIPYPGLNFNEDGDPTTALSEVPEDWFRNTHQMLRQKNFANEALYLEWRALEYDRRAIEMRAKAEDSRKMGDSTDRAKAKKFLAMRKKLEELTAQLAADGVDITTLMGE